MNVNSTKTRRSGRTDRNNFDSWIRFATAIQLQLMNAANTGKLQTSYHRVAVGFFLQILQSGSFNFLDCGADGGMKRATPTHVTTFSDIQSNGNAIPFAGSPRTEQDCKKRTVIHSLTVLALIKILTIFVRTFT